jgi:hypothetical protein
MSPAVTPYRRDCSIICWIRSRFERCASRLAHRLEVPRVGSRTLGLRSRNSNAAGVPWGVGAKAQTRRAAVARAAGSDASRPHVIAALATGGHAGRVDGHSGERAGCSSSPSCWRCWRSRRLLPPAPGAMHDEHERCRDDANCVPPDLSALPDDGVHRQDQCCRHHQDRVPLMLSHRVACSPFPLHRTLSSLLGRFAAVRRELDARDQARRVPARLPRRCRRPPADPQRQRLHRALPAHRRSHGRDAGAIVRVIDGEAGAGWFGRKSSFLIQHTAR